MSQAAATLILVALMFIMAIYFVFKPPEGFEENYIHRFAIPFLLVAGALTLFENLRMRIHMSKLIGAFRGMMSKAGMPATPEAKREAIEILIRTLRTGDASARSTAAGQLRRMTGLDHGEDAAAWEGWWSENQAGFGEGQGPS